MKGQRSAYAIHSWTGVLAGWLLFVICLTGTLVVYKYPLKALSNPEMARVEAPDHLGPDEALAAFERAVPEAKVRTFAFPSDVYSIHQYSIVAEGPDGRDKRYWISPESGMVRRELQSDFADFLQRLHAGLWMGGKGRWVVGALGLTMFVSLVAGLWFHWPHVRRDLFHLRLTSHRRKAWSDLHKMSGVWALPFHLIIALTGAWLGLEGLIGIRASSSSPIEIQGSGPGTPLPISKILLRAEALYPELQPSHVNITNRSAAGSTIRVQGDLPGHRLVQRGQTMFVFDADTGEHLQTVDRTKQGLGRRVLAMMRPLHYGYFWPGAGEVAYLLLGAASTLLIASGMFIWAERDRRKRFPRAADAVTAMERANAGIIGGILVALAVIALLHALARLPATGAVFGPLGGLRFLESQDLLSGRPITVGLWLFVAIWLAAGAILARLNPVVAWCQALTLTGAVALLLILVTLVPVLGTQLVRDIPSLGAGYALVCSGMAFASFLTVRRLRA